MYKKIVLVSSFISCSAFGAQSFGRNGEDGQSSERGKNGQSTAPVSLDFDGSGKTWNLSGQDGRDAYGSPTDGSSASNCQQANRPFFDLVGARGGDGGNAARGGNGGDGGVAHIYLKSEAQISQLKNLTIINNGGKAGFGESRPGAGGNGCGCRESSWNQTECTWTFYRTIDGVKRANWVQDQKTLCFPNEVAPQYQPYSDGKWEVTRRDQRFFSCRPGASGENGVAESPAKNGNYGWVVLYTGLDSNTKTYPTFGDVVGNIESKTYSFSGTDSEKRTGLKSLLNPNANVASEYWFRRYLKRNLKIEWKASTLPKDSNVANQNFLVTLSGTAAKPSFVLKFPNQLVKNVVELPDTTVVTIKRVLNTGDGDAISKCQLNSKKGSALCELSGKCEYFPSEDGDCLPK